MKPRIAFPPKAARAPLAACLALGAFVAIPATAATFVWDGGGDGVDLGGTNNWEPDGIAAASDVLEWNGNVSGDLSLAYNTAQSGFNTNPGISLNITSGQTGSLTIDGQASALRLNGNGITIAPDAGAFSLGNGAGTSNITIFNGTMSMTNQSSNAATLASDLVFATTFAANTTFNFAGSGDWQIHTNLRSTNNAGGNVVNVTGSGTLIMNAANTYTGGTNLNVNGGNARVRATADGALGTGTVFIAGNGGSNRLEMSGGITLANALAVNGKGNSPGQQAAILNVSGNNTLAGTITLNVGGTDNTIQSDAGLLTLSAATALTHGASGSRGVLFAGDGDITVSGAITQGGATLAVTKQDAGTLTLSANNTYTGATTVSAGTLLVNGSLANTATTVAADATIGGVGSLAGSLDIDGGAFFHVVDLDNPLDVAGTITFGPGFGIASLTGISWGSLVLDTPHTILGTTQVFSGGDLDNLGLTNAASVGSGRWAYFESGGLSVVVIPEPSAALLAGLGMLLVFRRRR